MSSRIALARRMSARNSLRCLLARALVREAVAGELVARARDEPDDLRIAFGDPAEREERRLGVGVGEQREDAVDVAARRGTRAASHSLRGDVRRERGDLEVVLDVDRQRVDDCRRGSPFPEGVCVHCDGAQRPDAPAPSKVRRATMRDRRRCAPPPGRPRARECARACRPFAGWRRRTRARASRSRPTSVFVPCVDRDRTLGVLAHRQARHGERSRLLLDAAGVGQHDACGRHQAEHLEIALRGEQRDRRAAQRGRKTEVVDVGPRARMHGPHQWNALRDVGQHGDRLGERLATVDVRRPMQRHDAEAGGTAHARARSKPARASVVSGGTARAGARAASRSSRCRRI